MDRLPLDPSKIPPVLAKYLGAGVPPGLKMAAARGMVPLKPVEVVTLLYCLQFDADPLVRETAEQGMRGLPPQVLDVAADAPLDPQVLDALAGAYGDRADVVGRIILNRHTSDETIELLAQVGSEQTIDLIAGNQVRFLRTPGIIKAMYGNPFARQATLESVCELANRNGIDTDALLELNPPAEPPPPAPSPGTAPAAAAEADVGDAPPPEGEEPPDDKPLVVADAVGADEGPGDLASKVPPHYLAVGAEFNDAQNKEFITWMATAPEELCVRLAQYGSPPAAIFLARHKVARVAMAVTRNKNLMPTKHWPKIAGDRQAHEDLIKYMCSKKDFTNVYNIKAKLALNPKTPISNAMGFVRGMRLSDLKTVAKNKAGAVSLQNTAKGILKMRGVKL